MGITIGIDLGTTNSVTCIKKIQVATIRNAEGDELTPSSVTAIPNSDGISFDFVVGRYARELLKQYPEQTVTSVKRLMGRDFDDTEIQNIIKENRVTYPIVTDPSEPGSIRIQLGGKKQTPEMISGIILQKLIHDAKTDLQGEVDQAVVTVPAYFSDRQKFATRAACDYAGIKLLRLLPEPTAAALSFGLGDLSEDKACTVMVFDLGGGTFDISVLSIAGGSFMEVTKGGDMWLGGDNIDQLLVSHIFSSAEKNAHCKPITTLIEMLSPADKARFLVEVKEKAEAAKIELGTEESVNVEIFGVLKDENHQLIDIDVTITRAEFSELIAPVVKQVSAMAKQILHEIRFEPELIDTVLMVGGTSLVPAIQDELRRLFGADKVMIHPRPMLAIAEGAAWMAAKMTSQDVGNSEKLFTMMHSAAHDYYLQLAGGKKHLLVTRNTPLPITVEEKLNFSHSEQSLARLRVFNEVDGVLDTVGELWFHKDKQSNPDRNDERTSLMLRFSVDEDNIITMKAWSLKNEQQSIEAQIARGGLAAKLYNDLERALSIIVANSDRRSVEEDAIDLSRTVIATILSASDPITGETRLEQKYKAQRQIQTLIECGQKNSAPLAIYEFAKIAQSAAAKILSSDEALKLQQLIQQLEQALVDLEDSALIKKLEDELEAFYKEVPIVADLAHAESSARLYDNDSKNEAKQIRMQAKKLADSYIQKDNVLVDSERKALGQLLHEKVSWYEPPSRRFDRDVCL